MNCFGLDAPMLSGCLRGAIRTSTKLLVVEKGKTLICYLFNGDEALLQHATSYYKKLFGDSSNFVLSLEPQLWIDQEKLNGLNNEVLDTTFTESKIKKSLI